MVLLDRRTALGAGVVIGATPFAIGRLIDGVPSFMRSRLDQPTGVRCGDVTTDAAVVWARSNGEGRLHVSLSSNGRRHRSIRGPRAGERTDHTARLRLDGLAPGREYDAALWFTSPDGTRSRQEHLTFRTAPIHPAPVSFVWSGDTCGQGWGINPDLGGLVGYRAMHDVHPDFFIHVGDHIYADETIQELAVEKTNGRPWRNEVTPALDHVAESLGDYRERYRYALTDRHVQAFNAEVPMLAQWDDHETTNNWAPGMVLDDARYTERRVDVLAARARRAFMDYMPIDRTTHARGGGDGFASQRIYRRIPRGPHLDVFLLDMRSHRDLNSLNDEAEPTAIFGREQADWLIREVSRSRATWKVVSVDLPLSVNAASTMPADLGLFDSVGNGLAGPPRGREHELARILTAFRRAGVRNVVFVTADVHYAAAHRYRPEHAAYQDFDEFWEFVAGPIHGSTFSQKELDPTFGPEVVFAKANDGVSQSPRVGNQFFGQCEIDAEGALTVRLRNIRGEVLWQRVMEPRASG